MSWSLLTSNRLWKCIQRLDQSFMPDLEQLWFAGLYTPIGLELACAAHGVFYQPAGRNLSELTNQARCEPVAEIWEGSVTIWSQLDHMPLVTLAGS